MSTAYQIISKIYGSSCAKRSGVPLINHIDEGLHILDILGSSDVVKDAYCLHPVLQSDESFVENKSFNFGDVDTESIILAMEYRRVANSYLSKDNIEDFVGFSCDEVKQMLIADKLQNYKDFLKYHSKTHERRVELDIYFNNWFKLLNIDWNEWKNKIGYENN
jgi:hypothetical protein